MNITCVGPVSTNWHGYGYGYSYSIPLFNRGRLVDTRRESGFLSESLAQSAGRERRLTLTARYKAREAA